MSRYSTSVLTAYAAISLILAFSAGRSLADPELRDPTRPPDFSRTQPEALPTKGLGFRLSAILVASGRRVAVINGIPVTAGDQVLDAEVDSILQDRVILRTPEGELVLDLIPKAAHVHGNREAN